MSLSCCRTRKDEGEGGARCPRTRVMTTTTTLLHEGNNVVVVVVVVLLDVRG